MSDFQQLLPNSSCRLHLNKKALPIGGGRASSIIRRMTSRCVTRRTPSRVSPLSRTTWAAEVVTQDGYRGPENCPPPSPPLLFPRPHTKKEKLLWRYPSYSSTRRPFVSFPTSPGNFPPPPQIALAVGKEPTSFTPWRAVTRITTLL